MRWLRDLPIRHKLTTITVSAVGIPLFLACAAFVTYDQISLRAQLVQALATRCQLIGRLSVSALEFKDPESGTATLASLASDPGVVSARVYDASGALFASYTRDPHSAVAPRLPAFLSSSAGYRFESGSLVVFQSISSEGGPVGTLVIESDLHDLTARLKRYAAVVAGVLLGSVLLAYAIASRLQRVLSGPVLHLVSVANAVTTRKDYSVRAVAEGRDELGLLTLTFNEMLEQIQGRDAAIQQRSAALRDSEQRLQAILDSTTAVIYVKDAEGRYLLINRRYEELFHVTAEDLIGKRDNELFPKERADVYRANDQRVIDTRKAIQVEESAPQEDGIHTYLSVKVPLLDADGNAYAMCGMSTDITESKRLEEARWRSKRLEEQNRQALEATRLKSEFLANMSHELRTPLNAIIGFAALLHKEKVGPVSEKQREFLGDILTSSRHLLQLINDVLDLAKVESGKMEFHPQPVALEKVLTEVRDILRTLAAEKRVSVDAAIDPGLGPLVLDPGKLKQVLYNYLSNALKFTPDGGQVAVRARPEGEEQFRLEVEDTGIGIRPEDLGRLFTEFTQLDGGEAKRYAGTGLGLALCKRIVEAQGGFVGVRSTQGTGSVFFAVLPRTARPEAAPEIEGPAVARRTGTPTILVVEDDARDRNWLARTLTEARYNVETVASGQEAAERTKLVAYDAITLDVLLPDMTGWDLLRAFRREGPNQDTPVIVVSVVAEKLAAEFRVHDFLTKPVDSQDLLAALRRAGVAANGTRPILVVDDDPAAIKLMRASLAELGYRSVPASDGQAALQAAAKDPPAAVVLDLLMPGMNGFEFLTRFRRTPEGRHPPVIVWTVSDVTEEMRQRLAASAQSVVMKGEGAVETLLSELERYVPHGKDTHADGR